jgi:hypothetical protein
MKPIHSILLCGAVLSGVPGARAELLYGLTVGDSIVSFDSSLPGSISSPVMVTGLGSGETLLGIDLRPATGELYGLSSLSRLYTINPSSGAATAIGSSGAFTLTGTAFGFDFNPTVDRIRVIGNDGQDLRLHPTTGALAATDGTIFYSIGDMNEGAVPTIVASAYINSVPGAATTTLYNIDAALGILTLQNPPNSGANSTVGLLNASFSNLQNIGFDVSGSSGTAFASLASGSDPSTLYTIDLGTGAATSLGSIGGAQLRDLTAATVPEPATGALCAAGIAVLIGMRSRRNARR